LFFNKQLIHNPGFLTHFGGASLHKMKQFQCPTITFLLKQNGRNRKNWQRGRVIQCCQQCCLLLNMAYFLNFNPSLFWFILIKTAYQYTSVDEISIGTHITVWKTMILTNLLSLKHSTYACLSPKWVRAWKPHRCGSADTEVLTVVGAQRLCLCQMLEHLITWSKTFIKWLLPKSNGPHKCFCCCLSKKHSG